MSYVRAVNITARSLSQSPRKMSVLVYFQGPLHFSKDSLKGKYRYLEFIMNETRKYSRYQGNE